MSQLFKKLPEKELLISFLLENCIQERNYCKLSPEIYKQIQYKNLIQPFLDKIVNCYHLSKQTYVTRKMTYPRFITILRHICKCYEINYTSVIKYTNSYYHIDYLFYINSMENKVLSL